MKWYQPIGWIVASPLILVGLVIWYFVIILLTLIIVLHGLITGSLEDEIKDIKKIWHPKQIMEYLNG